MNDLREQHALIDAHPFAILVTGGPDAFAATHVPFILRASEGALGTLHAHVAMPNPHAMADGKDALVIFSGPHGYVSPSWYAERASNVPTWNYVAVHCHGRLALCEHETDLLLREQSAMHEHGRESPWGVDELRASSFASLKRGVAVLRLRIDRIEGKAKLSQNKAVPERVRVADQFRRAGNGALADYMTRAIPGS